MPFFGAVKPNMAIDPKGVSVFPSAGPYRIVSRDITRSLTLERNPFYKGSRPANADQIVYTVNTDQNQSLLQVKAGQADYDAAGVPPTAHADLATQFGVKKGARPVLRQPVPRHELRGPEHVAGSVQPTSTSARPRTSPSTAPHWCASPASSTASGPIRSSRPASPASVRRRSTRSRVPTRQGEAAGRLGEQHDHADPHDQRAQDGSGAGRQVQPRADRPEGADEAAPVRGCALDDQHERRGLRHVRRRLGCRLPGSVRLHQRAAGRRQDPGANNSNYAYFNNPKYNKQMNDLAKLSGDARYSGYGKLDIEIMRNGAPWAPFANPNSREFISARLTNYIHHPVYAGAVVNALADEVRTVAARGRGAAASRPPHHRFRHRPL